MAETAAWVESGGGASPSMGVSAEGGAMVDLGRDDELRGPSPEANGWAPVEAALNWVSWLRVSRRLHTLNQVMAGAAVGSAFGALWFVLWSSLVQEAIASSPTAKTAAILVSAVSCVSVVVYMMGHWVKTE
ncbi:lipid phosphate phosphatase epsilon 1, chloroplastic-like [Panicum miliaceum]|uniref:Lipid phosphate phosphatase epsilon 1, chloroplastic-like n=1 Tax=Panicum miliaceum TaxID=4540 RepID=A0A3L6RQX3_PANMI|nr:lipid phosphate phosphatase epsilon 1, chloroplastic-like [Panicum miliaceum]